MKKIGTISLLLTGVVFLLLSISSTVIAHDQVVVVPLGGKKSTSPTENSFTNINNMTFNLLPADTFTMGSPDGSGSEPPEPGRNSNETQHQVTLTESFYMQTTEITNKQWYDIIVVPTMGVIPSTSHSGNNYPVETVNWFEAAYFANQLSVVEGRSQCYTLNGCNANAPGAGMECSSVEINNSCTGYRLPTEAQWEYAARATTTTAWPYLYSYDTSGTGEEIGNGFNSNLDAMGWYGFNRITQYADGTKPVARKQANKWGLYDMQGNVWEWCQDWYDDYSGDVTDPQGPADGSIRVVRGGTWISNAKDTRSACRSLLAPGTYSFNLGFRLVLPPGQ